MNLTQLLAEIVRRCRYNPTQVTSTTTRLTAELNETIREVLTLPGMARFRDDVIPVTALANTARSGLPPSVARILGITDRTNFFKLMQVPLAELRLSDPSQTNTGSYPQCYAVIGQQAVQVQPTSASGTGLWVASSSASDTTQKAYVETMVLGGYPQNYITAGTALNGITRVAIGTRTDHTEVTRFYLDAAAVGFVSLYDASVSGTELARLPIGKTFGRYHTVEWWPIPTANITEYADITRTVFDLVQGTDEPLTPPDFDDLLIQGTLYREYLTTDDSRQATAHGEYLHLQNALSSWVNTDGDRLSSLRRTSSRWNRLGPSYPPAGGFDGGFE